MDLEAREGEWGYTPLMLALVSGQEWAAQELLDRGADVRALSRNNRTALGIAAERGLNAIIELAVRRRLAEVDDVAALPFRLRLLHVVAFYNQPHTVSMLLQLGAHPDLTELEGGYTPLAMAILGGNAAGALGLLRGGADGRRVSNHGRSPMYMAVERGMGEVVRALVRRGVPLNDPATTEPSASRPLHVAVLYGQTQLLPMLVELGADLRVCEAEFGASALLTAVLLQSEAAVEGLLQLGADPRAKCALGRSALGIAAENGSSGIVRLLVQGSGVGVDEPCVHGEVCGAALHIAARHGHTQVVWQLLALGADPSRTDSGGRTALEIARQEGEGSMISLLEQVAASPSPAPSRTV